MNFDHEEVKVTIPAISASAKWSIVISTVVEDKPTGNTKLSGGDEFALPARSIVVSVRQ